MSRRLPATARNDITSSIDSVISYVAMGNFSKLYSSRFTHTHSSDPQYLTQPPASTSGDAAIARSDDRRGALVDHLSSFHCGEMRYTRSLSAIVRLNDIS